MLVVKLVEAALRIASGIGFDYSNHVIDSGLLGVFGLLGCCGPRQRQRSHRRQFRATALPPSEVSSFSPPNGPVPGKTHSGPPSVLRPEHALRPYREDSDDENGYIMGAWQPFPGPGPANENSSPVQPQHQTSTGFSRVGGGRAHFDSPYAITSESTQTFPSIGRNSFTSSPLAVHSDADLPPPSTQSQEPNQGSTPLPHVRTRSQTAVVENISALLSNLPTRRMSVSAEHRLSSNLSPPTAFPFQDEESDSDHPKKKPWYQRRRNRPRSEGSSLPGTSQPEPLPSGSEPGRSFVVIRDRKPQGGMQTGLPRLPNPDASSPGDPPAPSDRRRSTAGVEGKASGDMRVWNTTT
jgi:hypothetical protein